MAIFPTPTTFAACWTLSTIGYDVIDGYIPPQSFRVAFPRSSIFLHLRPAAGTTYVASRRAPFIVIAMNTITNSEKPSAIS